MAVEYVALEECGSGCRFQEPNDDEVLGYYSKIDSWFRAYLKPHSIPIDSIHTDLGLLGDAIVRVVKRKEYYAVFHNGVELNEAKEAALFAYWITKYRPFTVMPRDDGLPQSELRVNEGFAAFIIFSSVLNGGIALSELYVSTFMYALQYWDLSKESMMLIAETLYEASLT